MRVRTLIAAGLLALPLVAVAGSPAYAVDRHTAECFHEQGVRFEELVEEGESETDAAEEIDTCEESPNPILPATNEIIWGAFAFLVVFGLMWKLAVPAIRQGLKAREDHIRSDLEAGEAAKREAESVLEEYRRQLADARNEAGRIIEEARQAADGMRREIQARAEEDAAEVRSRAQAEIEQTVSRARADLQREVATFAIQLAERVVERNLDRDAQSALIDRYIEEVGGMRPNGSN